MSLPKSTLPDDTAYWDALASRIARDAESPLASHADWTSVLSRRAPWWLAASVAAMLALWLTLPSRVSTRTHWLELALTPHEVPGAMLGGPVPPSLEDLMSHFPPEVP